MESRPRDDKGKFIESSPFGKKLIAVRLFKSDQEKFFSQSEKLGISPTELARKAITEWLNEKEQPTKTA